MAGVKQNNVVVESALLTHGLYSISNESIRTAFHMQDPATAFVLDGQVQLLSVEQFLEQRSRAQSWPRINRESLPVAQNERLSGPLTASGTMAYAAERGIPYVVSCGIGGISNNVDGESFCPDLPALAELPVILLATAFKDMIDIERTFAWLRANGVSILGVESDVANGYLFQLDDMPLDGVYRGSVLHGAQLLLHAIPKDKRFSDLTWLQTALSRGHQAALAGQHFHPAVNRELDQLSNGASSDMQLESIVQNVQLAMTLAR